MAPASKKSSDVAKETKGKVAKKITKDANKPKRPASAYFIFLEDFRKEYKESNPDVKGVTKVTKAAGQRWKTMTDKDKQQYVDEQKKRKESYDSEMENYNGEAEKSEVVDNDEPATKKSKRGNKTKNVEETVDEEEEDEDDEQ